MTGVLTGAIGARRKEKVGRPAHRVLMKNLLQL